MSAGFPDISIIVPVYNAEAYVHRCVDSLLAQTFDNFEVVLVDDGSPDSSGAICDEYARKDSRIRVFHKENGGVASARQLGIDKARGEYTIHADPDDWVEPTMLEELYNKAKTETADMVICDFLVEDNGNNSYRVQQPTSSSTDAVLDDLLFNRLHGSLCNKLIRRNCYIKNSIIFAEGLNTSEDFLVCLKVLKNNPKVQYLNRAFYHYVQNVNPNNITGRYSAETYRMHKQLIGEITNLLQDTHSEGLMHQKCCIALLCMSKPLLTSEEFKQEYFGEYKELLPHIKSRKMRLLFTLSAKGYKHLSIAVLDAENALRRALRRIISVFKS